MKAGLAAASLVALVAAAAPASAHHALPAKFDSSKPLAIGGIVTLVDWRNPHVHVFVNVRSARGVVNWAVDSRAQSTSNATAGRATR